LESGQEVEPFHAGGGIAGLVEIDQCHIEIAVLECGDDFVWGFGGSDLIAFTLQQKAKSFENVVLIVGDEDSTSNIHEGRIYLGTIRSPPNRL
jgi:hypothetical protein